MHVLLVPSGSSGWCFLGKDTREGPCGVCCVRFGEVLTLPRPDVGAATSSAAGAFLQGTQWETALQPPFPSAPRNPARAPGELGAGKAIHSCDFLNSDPLASYFLCLVSSCQHWPPSSLI